MAPHNVYRCAGIEQWVAIVCRDDDDWRRLRAAMDDPEWARDPRFDDAGGRQAHEDELDERIANWTASQERYEVADRVAAAGVPAAAVQDARDRVDRDPQLRARGYFVPLRHAETGEWPFERPPFRLSDGDVHPGGAIRRGPPCIGEDTHAVLRDLLGLADAEIAALAEGGVLA